MPPCSIIFATSLILDSSPVAIVFVIIFTHIGKNNIFYV